MSVLLPAANSVAPPLTFRLCPSVALSLLAQMPCVRQVTLINSEPLRVASPMQKIGHCCRSSFVEGYLAATTFRPSMVILRKYRDELHVDLAPWYLKEEKVPG